MVLWDGDARWHSLPSTASSLSRLMSKMPVNTRLVYMSVQPARARELQSVAKKRKICLSRPSSLRRGLRFAYPSLGEDRRWNLIAGRFKTKRAFAVMDCGSAVTVDFVNSSGKHLGGWIWPGTTMMRDLLHLKTAQLPLLSKEPLKKGLGRSTRDSILVAPIHALEAFHAYVRKYLQRSLGSGARLFLTGGDSRLLLPSSRFDPYMGLKALKRVDQERLQKRGGRL
ncbi:MAG: type III pantothenate kinase [Bradymonadales bacterium]|nr:MAG: type III pantothenate kinase [Bradymonadales bacterium]